MAKVDVGLGYKTNVLENYERCFKIIRVRGVACHYGMACPQLADGGDTLQL
jgi:hypothetical protein